MQARNGARPEYARDPTWTVCRKLAQNSGFGRPHNRHFVGDMRQSRFPRQRSQLVSERPFGLFWLIVANAGTKHRTGFSGIWIDAKRKEFLGQRADVDCVAAEDFGTVRTIGIDMDFAAAGKSVSAEFRIGRQEKAFYFLVDRGFQRIERNDALLGDFGLDPSGHLDTVALPRRDQQLGMESLDRHEAVRAAEASKLPVVRIYHNRHAFLRQAGDESLERYRAIVVVVPHRIPFTPPAASENGSLLH
jgi:hypothetical protein